jgi:hypothetical protein
MEEGMADQPQDDVDFWNKLFREIEERQAKQAWDHEHTYVIDIIRILHGRTFGMRKVDLDHALKEKRFADKEPIPRTFEKVVQNVLNNYTSQSNTFRKAKRGPEDDLFYSPRGKRSGTWAVHTERAKAWLKRKLALDL